MEEEIFFVLCKCKSLILSGWTNNFLSNGAQQKNWPTTALHDQ